MRVVLDTNVWVSGLLWRGTTYRTVLHRPKFAQRLGQLLLTPEDIITVVLEQTELFSDQPPTSRSSLCADPTDNRIIECAQTSEAEWLITGDRDLLRLNRVGTMPILAPAEAVDRLSRD